MVLLRLILDLELVDLRLPASCSLRNSPISLATFSRKTQSYPSLKAGGPPKLKLEAEEEVLEGSGSRGPAGVPTTSKPSPSAIRSSRRSTRSRKMATSACKALTSRRRSASSLLMHVVEHERGAQDPTEPAVDCPPPAELKPVEHLNPGSNQ